VEALALARLLTKTDSSAQKTSTNQLGWWSVLEQWKQKRQERTKAKTLAREEAMRLKSEEEARLADTYVKAKLDLEAAARWHEAMVRAAEAATLAAADGWVDSYLGQLAPKGATLETAVNAALAASHVPGEEADLYRTNLIALARKFARPDERILGVCIKTSVRPPHYQAKLVGLVVILTHGFAVRSGSKQFRSDGAAARGTDITFSGMDQGTAVKCSAWTQLGDLRLDEAQDGHWYVDRAGGVEQDSPRFLHIISPPPLFLALRAQAIESTKAKSPAPRGSTNARLRPKPVLIRTWRDAELVAVEWMRYWGYTNVAATAVGADAGIDVVSNEAVTQVKAETSATGRPKVQQHHGVAVAEGKTAIFFALAGFTPAARTYADENAILLFKFDLQGEPEPVNTAAHALMAKPC